MPDLRPLADSRYMSFRKEDATLARSLTPHHSEYKEVLRCPFRW